LFILANGEAPKAFIVRADSSLTKQDVIDYVKGTECLFYPKIFRLHKNRVKKSMIGKIVSFFAYFAVLSKILFFNSSRKKILHLNENNR
jgi:hypothetical protein